MSSWSVDALISLVGVIEQQRRVGYCLLGFASLRWLDPFRPRDDVLFETVALFNFPEVFRVIRVEGKWNSWRDQRVLLLIYCGPGEEVVRKCCCYARLFELTSRLLCAEVDRYIISAGLYDVGDLESFRWWRV